MFEYTLRDFDYVYYYDAFRKNSMINYINFSYWAITDEYEEYFIDYFLDKYRFSIVFHVSPKGTNYLLYRTGDTNIARVNLTNIS